MLTTAGEPPTLWDPLSAQSCSWCRCAAMLDSKGQTDCLPATGGISETPQNVQLHSSYSVHTFYRPANALVRSAFVQQSTPHRVFKNTFLESVLEAGFFPIASHCLFQPLCQQITVSVEKESRNALFPEACRAPGMTFWVCSPALLSLGPVFK